MPDHDHSYKLLFSHREMVLDLLEGFVPAALLQGLDLESLVRVPGSYVSEDLEERRSDIVWRLRFEGRWLYLYLLFEFQSRPERYMALRMLAYVALLYQDLERRKELTPSGRLPPVLPVVLYNGKRRWEAVREIAELVAPVPEGFEPFVPRLRYLLLDQGRLGRGRPGGDRRNLAEVLFRLEQSEDPRDIQQGLADLQVELRSPGRTGLRRAFTTWVKKVLLPARFPGKLISQAEDLEEFQPMLEETVREWTEQWKREGLEKGLREGLEKGRRKGLQEGRKEGRQEGRKEGRKEGRREGEAALLLRLLRSKFGEPDTAVLQRVKAADAELLLTWGERVLTARKLEEIFGEEP
jgi:predicted transposase YdaD